MRAYLQMKKTRLQILIICLTAFLASAAYGLILGAVHHEYMLRRFRSEMAENASYVEEAYQNSVYSYSANERIGSAILKQDLKLIAFLAQKDPAFAVSDDYLNKINEKLSLTCISVTDRSGNLIARSGGNEDGLIEEDFCSETYAPLLDVFGGESIGSVTVSGTGGSKEKPSYQMSHYSMALEGDRICILSNMESSITALEKPSRLWTELLECNFVGDHGYSIVWNASSGEILYCPESIFINQDISSLKMDMENLQDRHYSWNSVRGREVYLYTVYLEKFGVWLAEAVSREEILGSQIPVDLLAWAVFGLLAAALAYYAILLMTGHSSQIISDFSKGRPTFKAPAKKKKLGMFTAFCLLIVFLTNLYILTLFPLSSWANDSVSVLRTIEMKIEANEQLAEEYAAYASYLKGAQMKLAAFVLQQDDSLISEENLNYLCTILEMLELNTTDEEGNILMNGVLSGKKATARDKAEEESDQTAEEPTGAAAFQSKKGAYFSSPMYSSENELTGYLTGRYYSDQANKVVDRLSRTGSLSRVHTGYGGAVFGVNPESGVFIFFPDQSLIGKLVSDYGISEGQLRDNYRNFIVISNEEWFVSTDKLEGNLFFLAIPKKELYRPRMPVACINLAIAALLLFLTGLPVYISKERESPAGTIRTDRGSERRLSPEYKAYRVLGMYAVAAAASISLLGLFRERGLSAGIVLDYVLDGYWEHGLNVFALTAALILVSEAGTVLYIARRFINGLADVISNRGGTILRMLSSLLGYIGIFYMGYQCLVYFGMDPTTLMASAGIVSVVLGIGANSMVGDILAGIFLLAEGDIQVGDVVTIGDFRGYVQDLGIRRTKIYDMDTANIKIIANSQVQNVVQMSAFASVVVLNFTIGYGEDLQRVEKILQKELSDMYGTVEKLKAPPVYLGVRELSDYGVTLLVVARTHESDRYFIQREINRRVYLCFKNNGIEIPYPSVTVFSEEAAPAPVKKEADPVRVHVYGQGNENEALFFEPEEEEKDKEQGSLSGQQPEES